jgi:hypothetical protein
MGLKVPYSGLKLHFAHTDGGLLVKGEKLGEFSIAGDDHKWHWADARIEGDTVIISSASVPNPKAARYAWQSNPAATLFNGAGLPAEERVLHRGPCLLVVGRIYPIQPLLFRLEADDQAARGSFGRLALVLLLSFGRVTDTKPGCPLMVGRKTLR